MARNELKNVTEMCDEGLLTYFTLSALLYHPGRQGEKELSVNFWSDIQHNAHESVWSPFPLAHSLKFPSLLFSIFFMKSMISGSLSLIPHTFQVLVLSHCPFPFPVHFRFWSIRFFLLLVSWVINEQWGVTRATWGKSDLPNYSEPFLPLSPYFLSCFLSSSVCSFLFPSRILLVKVLVRCLQMWLFGHFIGRHNLSSGNMVQQR